MWQRFTERARHIILLGQEEASQMGSGHVGTEHLLIGLVREDEGVAAQVLQKMGVTLSNVRAEIEREVGPSPELIIGEPKLTPKAKRVLELAADEARRMRHNYIGTEHLLLALLREKDGLSATVLRRLGLDLEKARSQVMEYLGPELPFPSPENSADDTTADFLRGAVEIAQNLGKNAPIPPKPALAGDHSAVFNEFFTPEAIALINRAATHSQSEKIGVEHLVLALLREENAATLKRGLAGG